MRMPLIWRRDRGTSPALKPDTLRATWQVVSLLLEYPDDATVARHPALREVAASLPAPVGEPLTAYLDGAMASDLGTLQREYVDTFDITRKCSLHLTYFTHGDTRRRGVALVEFKQAYRRAGAEMANEDAELPDFLPVVLEFGAFADHEAAYKLLTDHRVGIELLRTALARGESRWLGVVDALRATLPELDGDGEVALAKLIAAGPPTEEVGLDTSPYAIDPRLNPRPEPIDLGSTISVGAP